MQYVNFTKAPFFTRFSLEFFKGQVLRCCGLLCLIAAVAVASFATSSTTYWTSATTDIQPFGVFHIGVDNYFTVFKKIQNGGSAFPTDIGPVTIGVLPFKKLQMEVGVDILEPTDHPVFFNAKLGTPEGSLFKGSPALNIGINMVGTHKNDTNMNIVYGLVGKTIPFVGRLHVGPYIGNSKAATFVPNPGNDSKGFLIGFDHAFLHNKEGEFDRLVLAADYLSGKNYMGGGGVGLYYYFTKDISLLTGPVWFNDQSINGKWKWTIQLDINVSLLKKKKGGLNANNVN